MLRIGLVSDTHGLLRPQAEAFLAGSDCIVHAGDVGSPQVLEALAALVPLIVVRGNVDHGNWGRRRWPRVGANRRSGNGIPVADALTTSSHRSDSGAAGAGV